MKTKNLAIRAVIGPCSEEEEIYLPFEENLLEHAIVEDGLSSEEKFDMLKKKMSEEPPGVRLLELVNVSLAEPFIDTGKVQRDDYLPGILFYEDLGRGFDLYDRPFDDSPSDHHFCSWYTFEHYAGEAARADFSYYECSVCGRYVCEQNPSNGWHSQVHFRGSGEVICNKCQEEIWLREGINDDFDGKTIPGQFFNYEDIGKAGFEKEGDYLAGSRYSGYKDPGIVTDKIKQLIANNYKVLVNYESMVIGGLDGYVSIYYKS